MGRRSLALAACTITLGTLVVLGLVGSASAATTSLLMKERSCGERGAHCKFVGGNLSEMGNTLVFSLPLESAHDGIALGRDEGECIVLHRAAKRYYCDFVVHLVSGDVTVQGALATVFAPSVLAVTGGTGAYEGASGTWQQDGQDVALSITTP